MRDLSYLTDHYDEAIARVNAIAAPLNFIFITDMHNRLNQYAIANNMVDLTEYELGVNHIDSLQYVLDRCPGIQCVVNGGDIGNDYHTDHDPMREASQEIMDALYRLSVPVHCCVGNHDDAAGIALGKGRDTRKVIYLPDEMHELCMKYNPTPENYYYTDFPELGYRFVFLNTSDRCYFQDENGQHVLCRRLEVSSKQADWLEREALATDLRIIVFSHSPISNAGMIGSESAREGHVKHYDDLWNGQRVLRAVRSCPNVMALIAGHVHFDNIHYDGDLPSITTLCSFVQEWSPLCPKRVVGTVTETAFDVISIKDQYLYMTRFGAGFDRNACLLRWKA
ncbi:MAG: hypothetical protein E7463_11610 [Ruminococcaceae bacterium]|nr:hypothetical protein [Oscillospiraceae bacterium]